MFQVVPREAIRCSVGRSYSGNDSEIGRYDSTGEGLIHSGPKNINSLTVCVEVLEDLVVNKLGILSEAVTSVWVILK